MKLTKEAAKAKQYKGESELTAEEKEARDKRRAYRIASKARIAAMNPKELEGKPFLNDEETAVLLGISVDKLRADRSLGRGIPAKTVGKRVIYRRVDIDAYFEKESRNTAEAR